MSTERKFNTSMIPPVPSYQAAIARAGGTLLAGGEELMGERMQIFYEFLDSQKSATDGLEYKEKVRGIVRRGDARLIVNLNDVRHFNMDYARGYLQYLKILICYVYLDYFSNRWTI
jgi:MCM N-terminal domain